MRNTTERPEAVTAGTVKLVGTDTRTIVREIDLLLTNTEVYRSMSHSHNPYGDGNACKIIVDDLAKKIAISTMGVRQ
jgi:UDP-N-acetylglucosamine 2-epimerase (non-hydrolysing)